MVTQHAASATAVGSAEIFEQAWSVYRKVVDHNYLSHREAYGALRSILAGEVVGPFSFLDLACGDASATAGALAGTAVTRYFGVDLSREALALAEVNLKGLRCPVDLRRANFVEAIGQWSRPVDIAWIGLSLHHLERADKLAAMRGIRRILRPNGRLVIYENTSRDGEARSDWLGRWDKQRPDWTAFSAEDWALLADHVHGHDYPEPAAQWHNLGEAAGFSRIREVMAAPTDLFRMYEFRA
jgi:SAM-dependent methyltransferase